MKLQEFFEEYVLMPIKAIFFIIVLPFFMGYIFFNHVRKILNNEKTDMGEYLISIMFLLIVVAPLVFYFVFDMRVMPQ